MSSGTITSVRGGWAGDKPRIRIFCTTSSLKLASNYRHLLVIYRFSSSLQERPPIDLSEEIRRLQLLDSRNAGCQTGEKAQQRLVG
jgi:hypothetical protein